MTGNGLICASDRPKGAPISSAMVFKLIYGIGVGMIGFWITLRLEGCASCSQSLPSELILAAGGIWLLVPAASRRWGWKVGQCVVTALLAAHGSLLILTAASACWICIAFLTVEFLAWVLIVTAFIPSRGQLTALLIAAIVGAGAHFIALNTVFAPPADRIVKNSDSRGLTVYVILKRNCGKCDMVEQRMSELLQESGVGRVFLVDSSSPTGSQLSKEHRVSQFPTFIAIDHNGDVDVKQGVDILYFLRYLHSSHSRQGKV